MVRLDTLLVILPFDILANRDFILLLCFVLSIIARQNGAKWILSHMYVMHAFYQSYKHKRLD